MPTSSSARMITLASNSGGPATIPSTSKGKAKATTVPKPKMLLVGEYKPIFERSGVPTIKKPRPALDNIGARCRKRSNRIGDWACSRSVKWTQIRYVDFAIFPQDEILSDRMQRIRRGSTGCDGEPARSRGGIGRGNRGEGKDGLASGTGSFRIVSYCFASFRSVLYRIASK
ncbi:hypothetical protein BDN72DRAFT_966454 [Pluteus cervinus]|uniref:Uncharacterized protein n=1 Tax=Pluteus cervinus TaxID=181527 RepID=A0ACD2ZZ69_9AGAR|nr:hypothetical protein BDN72DRAFT_966454 [Pluteus cervinus]